MKRAPNRRRPAARIDREACCVHGTPLAAVCTTCEAIVDAAAHRVNAARGYEVFKVVGRR